MNENITNIIEQYLNGELSESDRKLFEQKMKDNENLRKEVEFQRQIHQAAKRLSIKVDIKSTAKTYHILRKLIIVGVVSLSLIIGTGIFYLIKNFETTKALSKTEQQNLATLLDKQAAIEHLPTHYFQWQGNDTVFKSPKGVLISVPKNAFLRNGLPYNEQLVLQFQEAMDVQDIVKSGLSTMSGDRLLETQGMFGVQAFTPDKKRLDVNPKVGVYVQVPVDQVKEGMMLFEGKKSKNGMIDWQNPKKFEKLPTLADIGTLNFYPPNYEDTLNKLKLRRDKKYRDSLYLSMEENYNGPENKGRFLYEQKCASCHKLNQNSTGPNLSQVRNKWLMSTNDKNLIYEFINNWANTTTKSKYVREKVITQTPTSHNDFPELRHEEIDLIFDYIENKTQNSFLITYNGINLSNDLKIDLPEIISNSSWQPNILLKIKIDKIDKNEILFTLSNKYDRHFKAKRITDHFTSDIDFVVNELCKSKNENYSLEILKKQKTLEKNSILYDVDYHLRLKIKTNKSFDLYNNAIYNRFFKNKFFFSKNNFYENLKVSAVFGENQYIPPSKVLAFWKPKFNNTNLSTRDFERRMQAIHATCNPEVLDVYTKNLNTSLSELDKRVVKMGYPEFQKFADEQIGKIELSNPHLELISKYYEKEIENLKEQVKTIESIRLKKEQKWNQDVNEERAKESIRANKRNSKNYQEEYEHNMNSVYKQLGKKRPPVVAFTITSNVAVYNIDRFVADRTSSRTSGTFYDKETKKTAKLEYKLMSLKVTNPKKYDRLFVYLFPNKLTSYHRIQGSNGNYSYNLNGEFVYDIAIVGFDENGYHFYSKKFTKAEDLGEIELESISEIKLNASLEQLNAARIAKPDDISSELKWILKEKEDYKVQKMRLEMARFRQRISRVVFPCSSSSEEYLPESEVADSLNIEL